MFKCSVYIFILQIIKNNKQKINFFMLLKLLLIKYNLIEILK